jgi:hypothetical protein
MKLMSAGWAKADGGKMKKYSAPGVGCIFKNVRTIKD